MLDLLHKPSDTPTRSPRNGLQKRSPTVLGHLASTAVPERDRSSPMAEWRWMVRSSETSLVYWCRQALEEGALFGARIKGGQRRSEQGCPCILKLYNRQGSWSTSNMSILPMPHHVQFLLLTTGHALSARRYCRQMMWSRVASRDAKSLEWSRSLVADPELSCWELALFFLFTSYHAKCHWFVKDENDLEGPIAFESSPKLLILLAK